MHLATLALGDTSVSLRRATVDDVPAIVGLIEAFRVRADHRNRLMGEAMIRWACDEEIRRGATLAQLTSDRSRTSAHSFYARLGFVPSHIGFTLPLQPQA